MLDSDQYSNYNSLQLTFNMRRWHNVSANGYYTLSKTMSSAELHNNTTQGGAQNFVRLADEYGRADTDQRHVFSASVNWEIDYYDGSNRLLARAPQRLARGADHQVAQRPAVYRHQRQRRRQPRWPDERSGEAGWRSEIDNPRPSAGSIPPRSCRTPRVTGVATDGNALRNQLDGPGFKVVDLAVSRISRCGRSTLTFRAEATNAFNIVNYGQPGTACRPARRPRPLGSSAPPTRCAASSWERD
jgi:hypothetical protein